MALPQAALIKPSIGGGGGGGGSNSANVQGGQGGFLPPGATVYFQHDQVQGEQFPLFVATGTSTVSQFNVLSRVGNGAAHTDTYTIVLNGVDTSMVVAITNGSSGMTTSNTVALSAGDWLAVKCVSDPATVAEDIIVQMKITS